MYSSVILWLETILLDEIEPCMSPQEIGRLNLSNVVFSTTWISISLIVLLYAYFILSTIINPNVCTFSPHFNSIVTLQHSTNLVQPTKMVTNISCTQHANTEKKNYISILSYQESGKKCGSHYPV